MARQHEYAREMEEAMTSLDHQFFGDYFGRFNEHLSAIPAAGRPVPVPNDKLYSLLGEALLFNYPHSNYKYGPFRYEYYHFLMNISPTWLRDCLVKRFIQMPEFWRKLYILHMLNTKACYFVDMLYHVGAPELLPIVPTPTQWAVTQDMHKHLFLLWSQVQNQQG